MVKVFHKQLGIYSTANRSRQETTKPWNEVRFLRIKYPVRRDKDLEASGTSTFKGCTE